MSKVEQKLLFINMEYSQAEINEPINVDVLAQYFPKELFNKNNTFFIYRDIDDKNYFEIEQYDIILISSKISSFNELQKILELCKNKIVILGGILAICAADKLAYIYRNVIFNTGEGEINLEILLRLAYSVESIKELKKIIKQQKIPNITFWDENEKAVYFTRKEVCDLKTQGCPRHYKVSEIIKQNGLVRMETSRGCPWNKCSFCIMPWKYCNVKWRMFSYSKIEEEIDLLIKSGAKQIIFTDEDFIGNYDHIITLCSIIEKISRKYKNKVFFGGSTSVLTLLGLGEDLDFCLARMKEVGIFLLFMGIESGSDSQLLRFNKGVSSKENEKIIYELQKYRFQIDVGFIMFDADTTMKELEENLDFIERTGLINSISRFAKKLRITPHTRFFQEYKRRNLITSDLDIDELFYVYKFTDPLINLISDYIEKMDSEILKESYHLQYVLRSTNTLEQKEMAQKRLAFLRSCSYNFLRTCINEYKEKKKISPETILTIYNVCLEREGQYECD